MKIIETKATHTPIVSTRLWNRCNQAVLISGGVSLLFGLLADVAMGCHDGGSTKRLSYRAQIAFV